VSSGKSSRTRAREGALGSSNGYTYREAIDKDPENRHKYGEKVRKVARELTDLCVWPPV
jgi:hypothetical protein